MHFSSVLLALQRHFPKEPPLLVAGYSSSHLPEDITVVTADFNLGTLKKDYQSPRSMDTYKNWMNSFSMLNNQVIAFTDTAEIGILLTNGRKHLSENMTKVIFINRNDLWSFHLSERISQIYQSPGYPKHSPNTVNENYSCSMHAKYDVLQYVIEKNVL